VLPETVPELPRWRGRSVTSARGSAKNAGIPQ